MQPGEWKYFISLVLTGVIFLMTVSPEAWSSDPGQMTNIVPAETVNQQASPPGQNSDHGDDPFKASVNHLMHLGPPQAPNQPQQITGAPITLPSGPNSVVIPADTVVFISLDQDLSSSNNHQGDTVSATVASSVFLGPYEVIPEGAKLAGQVIQANDKGDSQGHHAYLVVAFTSMKMSDQPEPVPFRGYLIAYKTGLRKQDYIWRLPDQQDMKKNSIRGMIGGAITGVLFNPIFGGPIGAGAGLLGATLFDKIGRDGEIKVKAHHPLPISVGEPFEVSLRQPASEPVQKPMDIDTSKLNDESNASWKNDSASLENIIDTQSAPDRLK